VDFDATGHMLIIYSLLKILEKKWEYNEQCNEAAIYRLQETYDTVRREALCNILTEVVSQ
jgi:hypothetical protein